MSSQNTVGIEQEIFQEFTRFFHGRMEKDLVILKKKESFQYIKEPIISAQIVLRSDDTDGVLLMKTDKGLLWESHPERKYGDDLSDEDFLDWAGEIVNRILGGLKNGLLARNITTTLQPPEAKFGEFDLQVDSNSFEVIELDIGDEHYAMNIRFALRRELGREAKAKSNRASA